MVANGTSSAEPREIKGQKLLDIRLSQTTAAHIIVPALAKGGSLRELQLNRREASDKIPGSDKRKVLRRMKQITGGDLD